MKKLSFWTLLILCIAIAGLVACGQQAAVPTQAPAAATEEAAASQPEGDAPLKIVYVSPVPIGVNEFLIMGQKGLEEVGDKLGAQTKVLESENDPTNREENVRAAVSDGANIVIVLGFEFNDIIPKVAPEAPDTQFLIVDQCIENPPANVHCAVFKKYEAAFLIGAIAASLSETNHVGAISALDIPFLHRYTDGFAEGAKYVKPDIEVSTLWVG